MTRETHEAIMRVIRDLERADTSRTTAAADLRRILQREGK